MQLMFCFYILHIKKDAYSIGYRLHDDRFGGHCIRFETYDYATASEHCTMILI